MDFMNTVLIVGSGGREHALAKALLRSNRPLCLFAYPGNPGMENDGCMLVERPIEGWQDLADWSVDNEIDLVVVGPEIPLVEGIADIFAAEDIAVFGPSKKAAQLEGSKAFSKNIMKKYGIPTAAFETFTDKTAALEYLAEKGAPIVIKASGLAAGKGAVVCETMEEARSTLDDMFDRKIFGDAGTTVVIEEKMTGEEASVFVLCDGRQYKILPVSQDHKRVGDNDTGPNTGGMGAYAPAPLVDAVLLDRIDREIIKPTLDAMRKEGAVYKGLLYCGVMVTPDGPKVVEYNCRFGDPETQAVLPLVDCDWYEVLHACATGTLADVKLSVREGYCVAVVMASQGYPGTHTKGVAISGIEDAEANRDNVDVYYAGTRCDDQGNLLTAGGRVLAVSAWNTTLIDAIAEAYEAVGKIQFKGRVFRRDIAAKGVVRLKSISKTV